MLKSMYWMGKFLREAGIQLDRAGMKLQGDMAFKEPLARHRRLMPLYDKKPMLGNGAFVAPNASVIGNVKIGDKSAIWYGAVLRGDVNQISIGNFTSIGDRTVVHVASAYPGKGQATVVGNNVTVEEGAILHACTLEDGSKVESGSLVFDGAVVGKGSIVGAGSVVTAGKKIPDGEFWAGSPAKFVRKVTDEEAASLKKTVAFNQSLAEKHDEEHSKTEMRREQEREKELYWEDHEDVRPQF